MHKDILIIFQYKILYMCYNDKKLSIKTQQQFLLLLLLMIFKHGNLSLK
jgi:hypothetical protein